ncbi:MAG: preprotein translocase subunit SecE [Peptostreptococcaceae bacterium]|nr:preprotein translocase subunit SecE [Peptostreptococcaceae bacterium]
MEKDIKKKPVAPPKKKRIGFGEYFRGIRTETKKVVWPTRKELGSYTVVVVLTCTFFALSFWAVDSAVLAALRAVLGITF